MIKQSSGKIVNIVSVNGIGAFPERASYGSAKAGVMQLTRTLDCEWAKHNINVNAIAPGYIKTPMITDLLAKGVLDALRYDAKGDLVVDVELLPPAVKQVLPSIKRFVGARLWCALFKKG